MALRTSLEITANAGSATAALDQVERGLADAGTGAERAGAQMEAALAAPLGAIAANTQATKELIASLLGATAAAQQRAQAVSAAAQAERQAAGIASELARAEREAAAEAASLAAAATNLRAQLDPLYSAQQRFDRELTTADQLYKAGVISAREYGQAQQLARENLQSSAAALFSNSKAVSDNEKALNKQFFAVRNAGQQVGDFGLQLTSGADPARAFSQQIGQLGFALSEFEGKAGAVGRFLVGPWGIALTIAAAVAAPFVEQLFQTSLGLDQLGEKSTEFVDVLRDSRSSWQEVTEAARDYADQVEKNSRTTVQQIRLEEQAAKARLNEAIAIRQQVTALADLYQAQVARGPTGPNGQGQFAALIAVNQIRAAQQGNNAAITQLQRALNAADVKLATAVADSQSDPVKRIKSRFDELRSQAKASVTDVDKLTNRLTALNKAEAGEIEAEQARERKSGRKPRSTAPLQEFGRDARDRIANIIGQFDGTPRVIDETNVKIRQLDDLIDDLARKKPPNFNELIASAERAKTVVREGLINSIGQAFEKPKTLGDQARAAFAQLDTVAADLEKRQPPDFQKIIDRAPAVRAAIEESIARPVNDILDQQREQLAVGDAILSGHRDQADVLRIQNDLRKMGRSLTEDQRGAILANTRALREQNKEQEALQRRQQNLLNLTSNVRGSIVDALSGRSTNIAGAIVDSFRQAFAEQLTQRFIDPIINKINDQILGEGPEQTAAKKFASAVDTTIDPLERLAQSAGAAANGLAGAGSGSPLSTIGGGFDFGGSGLFDAIQRGGGIDGAGGDGTDVTVTAKRVTASNLLSTVEAVLGKGLGSIESILGKPLGVRFTEDSSQSLGREIGKANSGLLQSLDKIGKGAFTGLAVAGIGRSIGVNLDNTGSAIGGALGSLIPIPGGNIIGSIAGGLFGGLFKPTPKAKGSAITSIDNVVNVTGTNGAAKDAVAQASKAVQDGISQIASALGADIGSFSVSIAKYKDSFRVDPTGSGSDGGKYGDRFVAGIGKFDNNDAAGAIAFAIADAIKDGAIKGISPAVAKALQSSTDINKAVNEALKVEDLELALGGVQGALEKEFSTFEQTAADRVRIAKQYGLDLVKTEELNGRDRLALSQKLLNDQVGSLQDLINQISFGSLFEGSAVDQRNKLLDQIASTRADANAGVDGAADKLAQLLEQLNSVSKDAFATTGGFASDQQTILDTAREAIAAANQRVQDAQNATDPALQETNAQLNESNDQLARINAGIGLSVDYLRSIAANSNGVDLSALFQAASFQ